MSMSSIVRSCAVCLVSLFVLPGTALSIQPPPVEDCDGNFVSDDGRLGNGTCDDDFNCVENNWDEGDCAPGDDDDDDSADEDIVPWDDDDVADDDDSSDDDDCDDDDD
ncbi:MAG TPA: hypothetical protein DIU15_00740, partial [Deltaproteobacteria bacterium]|nr:hypothetical protein [Deltaproteobacteria bacterium]